MPANQSLNAFFQEVYHGYCTRRSRRNNRHPAARRQARRCTDGFGRSETRAALRRFFEVDAECIAIAALAQLAGRDLIEPDLVEQAIHQLGVDPEKVSPMRA
jgi:pyruvate dehydrogenase complex dehydrogenase (E1) component